MKGIDHFPNRMYSNGGVIVVKINTTHNAKCQNEEEKELCH